MNDGANSPAARARRRFRKNGPAVVSIWFLATLVVLVIAWPLCLKMASVSGNARHLQTEWPGNDQHHQRREKPDADNCWPVFPKAPPRPRRWTVGAVIHTSRADP